MSDLVPPSDALPFDAQRELEAAVAVLERSSLAARLASVVGMPLDMLRSRLPGFVQSRLQGAVQASLGVAMRAALRSRPDAPSPIPSPWLHRGLATLTGAAGGALGLPGTLLELPVSTTVLLRQIAAVAAEQGEDLAHPRAGAECLAVFALGARDPADDSAESGYFAMRLGLAEAVRGVVGRSLLPGFVGVVASRFAGPVALKLGAQAAPVLGAAAGVAINLAFLEHFRGIAQAHFTVRRLEREHGAERVQAAYAVLKERYDVPFHAPTRSRQAAT